jgi:protein N-terminal methyltransferase
MVEREGKADIQHSIGRITEGLLLGLAETVDIVEPIAKFSDNLKNKPGIGQIYNVGLEDWSPGSNDVKYDLIWNQWCLGHLTDVQLVAYLEKCGKAVKEGGLVVVKENMSSSEEDIFDEVDSSVTRYVHFAGVMCYKGNADERLDLIRSSEIFLRKRG